MASVIEIILKARGGKQVESETDTASSALKGLNQTIGGLAAATGLALGTRELARFGLEAFNVAAQVERLSRANDNLAQGLGTTSQQMVRGIQQAAGGTVDQMTALQAANKAMLFGIVDSQAEMEELTRIAVTLGSAMGQSAAKSLDDLTVALGRNSPLILDNLGISIKLTDAYRIYAESIGKSVDALNEEEKAQAFRQAALIEGRRRMEELGGVTVDTATQTEALAAAWSDFKVEFGELLTLMSGGISTVTTFVGKLTEGAKAWQYIFKEAIPAIKRAKEATSDLDSQILASSATFGQYQRAMVMAGRGHEALSRSAFEAVKAAESMTEYEHEAHRLGMTLETIERNQQAASDAMQEGVVTARVAASEYATVYRSGAGMELGPGVPFEPRLLRQQAEDRARREQQLAEETARTYRSTMEEAANRLRSTIESVLQPTLSEIWSAPEGARIDEWARRMATLTTDGLASEWIPALEAQFGGTSFWEPIAAAIESGDEGVLRERVTALLAGPGVMQLWDKELIKERIRQAIQEQNMRQELIDTIMQELSAEGLQVEAGDVSLAMGGGLGVAGSLVGGMQAALPQVLAGKPIGTDMIKAINAQIAADSRNMAALALTFVAAFHAHIPTALGATDSDFLDLLTVHIAGRLGLALEMRS